MTRYIYAEKTYETVDEVQAAVLKMKTRLIPHFKKFV